ncbi:hypothetical protein [endosymbiont of Lamellibrachia barhami]|uniref:hypothetical protein n=1 Tax=endosymbiont of Lamellibrachia barhami TaxID=205975 RepID=UPI001C4D4293|nr:hypothetical protein [endosymbiont of Lamellibrachia barhami]
MATPVYLIMRSAKDKARQLFEATFADVIPDFANTKFLTSNYGPQSVKFRYLARGYRLKQRDWEKERPKKLKQTMERYEPKLRQVYSTEQTLNVGREELRKKVDEQLGQWHGELLVDYCLSRALGYIMKNTAPSRYTSEKINFNSEFTDTGNYRDVTRMGHLALRTNNAAFVLTEILGAKGVHIAKQKIEASVPLAPPVSGVTETQFETVARLHNLFQTHASGRGSFAMAAVYAGLLKQKQGLMVIKKSGGDARFPRLSYNHWVNIEKFDLTTNNVELLVWTWAKFWRVRVDKNVFLSYIQDVIFGHF